MAGSLANRRPIASSHCGSTRTSSSVKTTMSPVAAATPAFRAAEIPGRSSRTTRIPVRPTSSPGNGSGVGMARRLSTRMYSTSGYRTCSNPASRCSRSSVLATIVGTTTEMLGRSALSAGTGDCRAGRPLRTVAGVAPADRIDPSGGPHRRRRWEHRRDGRPPLPIRSGRPAPAPGSDPRGPGSPPGPDPEGRCSPAGSRWLLRWVQRSAERPHDLVDGPPGAAMPPSPAILVTHRRQDRDEHCATG